MIYKRSSEPPANFAIASIHIFNMSDVPFNRGLKPAQVTDPVKKLDIIKTAIEAFLFYDPGIPLDKFVVVNSGTDCKMTLDYYNGIDGKVTNYGATVKVIHTNEYIYPGPYGARQAVYHTFPHYKFYFDCDNDCMPMMDGWYKDGLDRLNKDQSIGLLGANISDAPFQCKDNIKWYDKNQKEILPPSIRYNSGFYTFIPGHIYKLFDEVWGTDWFSQGSTYYDFTASQGELGFSFKVQELGYSIADFCDDETDAFYSYIVPDSLFPNFTIGNVDDYPSRPKLCPFYHAQVKLLRMEKWNKLQEYVHKKFGSNSLYV